MLSYTPTIWQLILIALGTGFVQFIFFAISGSKVDNTFYSYSPYGQRHQNFAPQSMIEDAEESTEFVLFNLFFTVSGLVGYLLVYWLGGFGKGLMITLFVIYAIGCIIILILNISNFFGKFFAMFRLKYFAPLVLSSGLNMAFHAYLIMLLIRHFNMF